MISDARRVVRETIKGNKYTRIFFMVLAGICIIVGIVVGFLAAHVQIWLGVVELVIAPGLVYSIRGIVAADKNNVTILRESSKVFYAAQSQIQLRRRLQ